MLESVIKLLAMCGVVLATNIFVALLYHFIGEIPTLLILLILLVIACISWVKIDMEETKKIKQYEDE